jgi:hypothetical protein
LPKIRDITDPTEFIPEPTTPWWIWSLVATAVLLIVVVTILLIRKHRGKCARRTDLDEARARLVALKERAVNLSPEEIATKTSIIIRHYLEAAFDDPAIFETKEEFTLRTTALPSLEAETRSAIVHHLQQLSELKYEPHANSTAAITRANTLIDEAEQLLAHIDLQP